MSTYIGFRLTQKQIRRGLLKFFLILFSEGHATAWIFFEAKRKKLSFFSGLWKKTKGFFTTSISWIGTARHDSPQVGGEGNSPPRATTQNGAPPGTLQSDTERTACPFVSLMSKDYAGAPPKVLRKQHGGNGALHVSRSLLERQRASRGVTFEPVKCSFFGGKKWAKNEPKKHPQKGGVLILIL